MFFRAHSEYKIGYKQLSFADLGLSPTSNQTHIGLYENILDFLDNEDSTTAMLIYNDYCDILECDFDRIMNPDGTFRSPKIRKGTEGQNTIVKQIRSFAHYNPNRLYYLIWFGLEGNELVFWLIDNTTEDFRVVNEIFPNCNKVYQIPNNFLTYLESKIDRVTIELQKDLEIASQVGNSSRKFSRYDIKKATERFARTGRLGEELVAEYLDQQLHSQIIFSYEWCNRSNESGLPYDFVINGEKYVDVKSTQYDFEQQIIFSDSEFDFISTKDDNNYSVFRIFDLASTEKKLTICRNCQTFIHNVTNLVHDFDHNMASANACVRSIKIAVEPYQMFTLIDAPIILSN